MSTYQGFLTGLLFSIAFYYVFKKYIKPKMIQYVKKKGYLNDSSL